MFLLLFPHPRRDPPSPDQRLTLSGVVLLGVLMVAGLVLFAATRAGAGVASMLIVPLIVILAIAAGLATRVQASETGKRKRGLDGQDMYTLIDRLVDDLDDDEAAYLRHRLDDRDQAEQHQETEDLLADALERRAQDRQAR